MTTADILKIVTGIIVSLGGGGAATELRMNLDKVPLWRGNDVAVKQLREDLGKYLYLPKLLIPDLLRVAIENGVNLISWQRDTFAFAESFDTENNRYRGLRAGVHCTVSLDGNGLVIKPEVAEEQLSVERLEATEREKNKDGQPTPSNQAANNDSQRPEEEKPDPRTLKKTRFFGHLEVDAIRFFRDTENIEKEILKHLNGIKGTNVKITIHIEAENKEGFTQDAERTLKENGRTLGFGNVEFE